MGGRGTLAAIGSTSQGFERGTDGKTSLGSVAQYRIKNRMQRLVQRLEGRLLAFLEILAARLARRLMLNLQ